MARRIPHPKDGLDESIEKIDTAINRLQKIPKTEARDIAIRRCEQAKASARVAREAIANIRVWGP